MKIIFYLIMFYVAYKVISMIFRVSVRRRQYFEQREQFRKPEEKPKETKEVEEGDYIDYEEIK